MRCQIHLAFRSDDLPILRHDPVAAAVFRLVEHPVEPDKQLFLRLPRMISHDTDANGNMGGVRIRYINIELFTYLLRDILE